MFLSLPFSTANPCEAHPLREQSTDPSPCAPDNQPRLRKVHDRRDDVVLRHAPHRRPRPARLRGHVPPGRRAEPARCVLSRLARAAQAPPGRRQQQHRHSHFPRYYHHHHLFTTSFYYRHQQHRYHQQRHCRAGDGGAQERSSRSRSQQQPAAAAPPPGTPAPR
ncbi:hypothetical protein Micbo1qcDRAFT_168306, partial [Microdochium bolleyi]